MYGYTGFTRLREGTIGHAMDIIDTKDGTFEVI